jgi:hypothetical protein
MVALCKHERVNCGKVFQFLVHSYSAVAFYATTRS